MAKKLTTVALMLIPGGKIAEGGSLLFVEHSLGRSKTPNELLEIMRGAVKEYLASEDGVDAFSRNAKHFNWGDAESYIPMKLWQKHGIHRLYHPDVSTEIALDCWEEFRPKLDQLGNPLPTDLVTLPDIENLRPKDIKIVEKARWYEALPGTGNRFAIMASAKELNGLSEDDPTDSGIDLNDSSIEIWYISDALKRHGEEGFYHA